MKTQSYLDIQKMELNGIGLIYVRVVEEELLLQDEDLFLMNTLFLQRGCRIQPICGILTL